MRIAIHQPNYLPWCGYFYKMAQADLFIFLDNCQISVGHARAITNRTKILADGRTLWLTVPIGSRGLNINQVVIDNSQKWREKHFKTLCQYYRKAPYFEETIQTIQTLYREADERLLTLNIRGIKTLADHLGIHVPCVFSSDLAGANGADLGYGSERIINICKAVGADTYLSGEGARSYNDEEASLSAGIHLEYINFNHPSYPQLGGSFIPGLSVMDLLFNCGPRSREILFGANESALKNAPAG